RLTKGKIPSLESKSSWQGTGWRGERIAGQIVLWANEEVSAISIEPGVLRADGGKEIAVDRMKASFIDFVLTDEFGNGCEKRKPADFDSSLVADIIDHYATEITLEKNSVRPVWFSVDIPADQAAGTYTGAVIVQAGEEKVELSVSVKVIDRVLPPVDQWKFHLDLWQNPFSIARVYGVELWSEEHFEIMRPHLELLANAGQKCITTTIIEKPWNGQTFDPLQSMVRWTLHKDSTWSYDYTLFDRWVEFAMSCGITEQINCYTMIPWHLKFEYFDEVSASVKAVNAEPGSTEYNSHWTGMLNNFTTHLKEKGWFEKTTISMDERPAEAMRSTIALLREAAPGLKVTLAGGYHPEIEADLFDYCIASEHHYPKEILSARNSGEKFSTFYTCCVENYPNTFTFSPPAESTWLGWYAAAEGFGGYLRWAYNSWVKDPLQDSRYRAWPAGDTYLVYPGARTSIRFERLREGIQDFEKIRILKSEWAGDASKLASLEELLASFTIDKLETVPAAEMVNRGKELLNRN
ncbi:MAG: DUF4091 domain-containing protein, partial [Cyclobacteriaceae bacterium]|nr:DUF4091 domain-containing protein [Cyclobacteriaceae bacterium]